MTETHIILSVLKHLITAENAKIRKISYHHNNKKKLQKFVNTFCVGHNVKLGYNCNPDILAYQYFKSGRPQKNIKIEAKGDTKFYNFYTLLGQLILTPQNLSSYYWYGLAVSTKWEAKIRKLLEKKELIQIIFKNLTKNNQGLYFYFVDDHGDVVIKNFNKLLS